MVLDASHAFDAEITAIAHQTSAEKDLRYLRILRPAWRPSRLDHWLAVHSIPEAAGQAPATARVMTSNVWVAVGSAGNLLTGYILILPRSF